MGLFMDFVWLSDVLKEEAKGSLQETGYLDLLGLMELARVTDFATPSFEINITLVLK